MQQKTNKKVKWPKLITDVICFLFLLFVMILGLGKPVKISISFLALSLFFRYIIYKNDELLAIKQLKGSGKVAQGLIAVIADIGYIVFLYLGLFYYNI